MRTHYPRTTHLPWSPGVTSDDLRAAGADGLAGLAGREVVVTEKLDGENTTLYADGLHARSLDSGHHPSRAWVKGLQSRIGGGIPAGWRVCGENMYARHSLAYEELDAWFYAFSVWDGDHCLDWDRTVAFLRGLGVPAPRVLWRGVFDERALRKLRLDTARQEGYVVRTVAGFEQADFGRRVAKWVRGGHVQTDTHWMYAQVVPNGLGPAAALWDVRSGAEPDVAGLLRAVGMAGGGAGGGADPAAAGDGDVLQVTGELVAEVAGRIDGLGVRRSGEERLAGILAAALHGVPRARLAARLAAGPLGMATARRVADLVGLYPALRRPFPYPDAERHAGLVGMAEAVDLGVLHALARAVPAGPGSGGAGEDVGAVEAAEAVEAVDWSALCAEEAGLLGPAPLEPLRAGLRTALAAAGIGDADAADRCWAEAREAYGQGKLTGPEEAVAATWRWRDGTSFPGWCSCPALRAAGRARTPAPCRGWRSTSVLTICARPGVPVRHSGTTRTCSARAWTGSTRRWPQPCGPAEPSSGTPPRSPASSAGWPARSRGGGTRWSRTRSSSSRRRSCCAATPGAHTPYRRRC